MCLILIEGYVADEIITSAAGTRVRVGNTDAEGRMAMADSLHYMKLKVNDRQWPWFICTGQDLVCKQTQVGSLHHIAQNPCCIRKTTRV